MSEEVVKSITITTTGVAGMFIALGVFLEERATILKIASAEPKPMDEFLNSRTHIGGLGLLIIALFVEIFLLMIEVPNSIFNTHGLEHYLFYIAFFLIFILLVIQISLTKDILKTYFTTNLEVKEH
jgi:hypothetical protein